MKNPLTKEQYRNTVFYLEKCKKCSACFLSREEDKIWIPFIGPKYDEQDNMIDQNTTLAQRTCRPFGDASCINPDLQKEGGLPWDTLPLE